MKAILDANRNSLMLLDLKFSIGTLGIGSGAFIASLYGMNLKNFIEESDGLTKLRKVQRVSMWGEQGHTSRGSWRDVGALPPLPGESRIERLERSKRAREAKYAAWRDYKERAGFVEGRQMYPQVYRRGRVRG